MNPIKHSETITLAAGEVGDLISSDGDAVTIFPQSADEYSTDILVKIDDSGFKQLPTATKVKLPAGQTFKSVQFKNSGAAEVTFHVLIVEGDVESYNTALNGDISVAAVSITGTPNVAISGTPNVAIPGGVLLTGNPTVNLTPAIITLLERIADATEGTETNTATP